MSLPSGTITFLFSDVAGSTSLWESKPHAMGQALEIHDRLLREAVEAQGGHVFKMVGDALHAVFARPEDAVTAAVACQMVLAHQDWGEIEQLLVRMALHTGTAELRDGDYFGSTVNRVARVLALAYPGQILLSSATAELAVNAPLAGTSLRELGEFELKGLAKPERLYQFVHPDIASAFPPVRSAEVTPTNLRPQLSSFVGRETELGEVSSALRRSRLVTLTGAGGSGKTRLAIEASSSCLSLFSDGIWLAELAAIGDDESVPRAIAAALAIREEPGRLAVDTLCDELRIRSLLLVLDNCEHLLDASAVVAEALLRSCPALHILATSREALGIQGEISLRIPSLRLPTTDDDCRVEDIERFDATKLFVERAQTADPSFEANQSNCATVVQVCRRLDGIPLAIELAASRLRGMPIGQLAARLDDRFRILTGGSRTAVSRQRTLQALIDWSYDLLAPSEQALLRSISVFAGGWTLEAAEAVGGDASEVPDLLSQLVEKSLVLCKPQEDGSGRYHLLEMIRQYASDKLAEVGEAESARIRHLSFFEALGDSNAAIGTEWENLRVAIAWALDTDVPKAVRLTAGLAAFCETAGRIVEGSATLMDAIELSETLGNTPDRLEALLWASRLALRKTDVNSAMTLAQKTVAMAHALGDGKAEALATAMEGNVFMIRGDAEEARRAFGQTREMGVRLADPELQARGTYGLMLQARQDGNQTEFRRLLDEVGDMFAMAGMVHYVAWTASYEGAWSEEYGDLSNAACIYADVLKEFLALGNTNAGIWHWECMARLCARTDMHESAAALFGAADAHRRKIGWPVQPNEVPRNERARDAGRSALGDLYESVTVSGGMLSYEEACSLSLEAADLISSKGKSDSPQQSV